MPKNEIVARHNTELVLLARGYSWQRIKELLGLSIGTLYKDKEAVERRRRIISSNISLENEYAWFREFTFQIISDIQEIIDQNPNLAPTTKITALRIKHSIAIELMNVAAKIFKMREEPATEGGEEKANALDRERDIVERIFNYISDEGSEEDSGETPAIEQGTTGESGVPFPSGE